MSELQVIFLGLYSALLAIPLLAAWDNRRQLRQARVRQSVRNAR